MKKFLITVFTVMLLTAMSFTTGCLSGKRPEDTCDTVIAISEEIFDADEVAIFYDLDTEIYHLKAGEQYYLDIRKVECGSICRYGSILEHLIYEAEEVEISENEYSGSMCKMRGLKNGSVIIQFDDRINDNRVKEGENYLKILIMFE